MEKDDSAIYSRPPVPDLPIKYRSQKGSGKEIRLRTVEAVKQREHLWDLTQKEGS